MIDGRRPLVILLATVAALTLTGCGGGQQAPGEPAPETEGAAPAAMEAVEFAEPQAGSVVSSPVTVKMVATDFEIEPAGEVHEGAGHFHIMIDAPCVDPGQPIPADDSHKHFGKAQDETQLELAPGQHILCLQAGDGAHTALDLTDAITITVQ